MKVSLKIDKHDNKDICPMQQQEQEQWKKEAGKL